MSHISTSYFLTFVVTCSTTNDADVVFLECAAVRESVRGGGGARQGHKEARRAALAAGTLGTVMVERGAGLPVTESKFGAFFQQLRLHSHAPDGKQVFPGH